jgi:NADP-dependent 3-hydroxy acid dehydrogenase YdfG
MSKNVLIIGGGTGMGEAIALSFAKEGWKIAIAGRRQEKLDTVIQQATEISDQPILSHTVDVGVRSEVEALFQWFAKEVGNLDIMVNCAGINVADRTMENLDPENWDKLLRINATGAYDAMRCALSDMRPREDGIIINISSVAGKRAVLLGGVAYNASKFAMTALGTTVSEEVKDLGIRVTNVYPGEVNTPILDNRPVPPPESHRQSILQAQDVADAVLMVAKLPPRAHIPELVIKPTKQSYV